MDPRASVDKWEKKNISCPGWSSLETSHHTDYATPVPFAWWECKYTHPFQDFQQQFM